MKKLNIWDFLDNMVVGRDKNPIQTRDFLWKIANYRDENGFKNQVIDYLASQQTKINGHLVAPIVLNTKGETGYNPLGNKAGDDVNIYMTQEEVETFNKNFTQKDYKEINRFAMFGK